jgi:hypothetical protein
MNLKKIKAKHAEMCKEYIWDIGSCHWTEIDTFKGIKIQKIFIEMMHLVAEAIKLAEESEQQLDNNKCNSGHETLPLRLWNCPTCVAEEKEKPIDMILYCAECGMQHIDKPDPENNWLNPPHREHLCGYCGHLWTPSLRRTNGVEILKEIDAYAYVEVEKNEQYPFQGF